MFPHLGLHWKQRRMGLSEGGHQLGWRELWSRSSLICGLEKTCLNEVCQTLFDWVSTRDFVWFCSLYADVFFCWKMLYYWPSPLSSLKINFHQETSENIEHFEKTLSFLAFFWSHCLKVDTLHCLTFALQEKSFKKSWNCFRRLFCSTQQSKNCFVVSCQGLV